MPSYAIMDVNETRLQRFGKRLKELRVRFRLSERALALAMHRTSTFVRSYEAGKASLTIPELEQLAVVFGVSLSQLIDEYERPSVEFRTL